MTRAEQGMLRLLRPLGLYRLDGTTLVDGELAAYGAAFALAEEAARELMRESLIQTSEGRGLALREQAMGLYLQSDKGPEKRRQLLIYRLSVAPWDSNPGGMERSVRAAGLAARLVEDVPGMRLQVIEDGVIGSFEDLDALKAAALQMLPAHLEVEFQLGSFTWDDFERADATFDECDGKDASWNKLELDGGSIFGTEV